MKSSFLFQYLYTLDKNYALPIAQQQLIETQSNASVGDATFPLLKLRRKKNEILALDKRKLGVPTHFLDIRSQNNRWLHTAVKLFLLIYFNPAAAGVLRHPPLAGWGGGR